MTEEQDTSQQLQGHLHQCDDRELKLEHIETTPGDVLVLKLDGEPTHELLAHIEQHMRSLEAHGVLCLIVPNTWDLTKLDDEEKAFLADWVKTYDQPKLILPDKKLVF